MEEAFKTTLLKIVSSYVEKPYREIAVKHSAIGLSLDAFSQKVSEVVLNSFGCEIEDLIGSNKRHLLEHCIEGLQLEDLFLATACARGDNSAWETFSQRYKDHILKIAHVFCNSPDSAIELAESICSELFLPRLSGSHRENKISTYNGRCSLQGWLKVVISHAAVDSIRRKKPIVQLDADSREQQSIAVTQPASSRYAIDFDDAKYLREVERALEKSLKALSPKEKLLLDYYYYHELSLKEIGVYFNVHEATISRWLEATRKKIKKSVERTLKAELGLKQTQLKELWAVAVENVNVELRRLIGSKIEQ